MKHSNTSWTSSTTFLHSAAWIEKIWDSSIVNYHSYIFLSPTANSFSTRRGRITRPCRFFLTLFIFRNLRQSSTSALGTAASGSIRRHVLRRGPGAQTGTGIADVADDAVPATVSRPGNATPAWSWSAAAYRSTPAAQSTEQANVIQG